MSALPILANLLRSGLPGVVPLDLTLPRGWMLPHWPGIRAGVADPARLPRAEHALLARFRQPDGLPLFGFDPAADAAMRAGAPAAWDGGLPLLVLDTMADAPRDVLAAGGLALIRDRGGAGDAPQGLDFGRIMILVGSPAQVERFDLLMPAAFVPALFEALRAAAGRFGTLTTGWRIGGRLADPRLASLGVISERASRASPAFRLAPSELPNDLSYDHAGAASRQPSRLPSPSWTAPLALADPGRCRPASAAVQLVPGQTVRLLVGALPPLATSIRIRFQGVPPVLLHDGRRVAAHVTPGASDEPVLEASIIPAADLATIIGLGCPPDAPLAVTSIEFGA